MASSFEVNIATAASRSSAHQRATAGKSEMQIVRMSGLVFERVAHLPLSTLLSCVAGADKPNEVNTSSVVSTEEALLNGNSGEDM